MSKKKILSLVLCLVMVLSLLPVTSLAAGPITTETITVNGVKAPIAGEEITTDGITVSSSYMAFYKSGSEPYCQWQNYAGGKLTETEFVTNYSYRLMLRVYATDGLRWLNSDSKPTVKIPGAGAGFYNKIEYQMDAWGNSMFIYIYYDCRTYIGDGTDPNYPTAYGVTVDYTIPEMGKHPDSKVTVDSYACKATDVKWYAQGSSTPMGTSDTFLAGVKYTLEFTLQTIGEKNNFFLSKIAVDGFPGEPVISDLKSHSAKVRFTFDPLDSIVTSVSLKGIKTPVGGQPKQTSGITVEGKQCYVSSVSVKGNFDASGNYKSGESYTMRIEMMPNSGYTFKSDFNKSMVKVDNGTVDYASLTEFYNPYVSVKLTAGGEKEKIDKGNITFDLTKGIYVVPSMTMAESDLLSETINWLAGENKIKVVSDGYQLNGSGLTDVVVQTSGGVTTMKQGDSSKQAGSVVLSLSQATIDSQISAGGAYYSSVTFKFPGGGAPADLGKLSVDLTKGTFTIPGGETSGKAFEDTVKACSQVTYKTGDPSGLDLDKEGVSDVLLSWSGGSLLLDASSQTSVSGAFTLTPDKTAVMKLTEQGAPSYYSGITFQFPGGGFDPTGLENPFKDVAASDYFYVPVLWAYYTDPQVTVGISATRFGPDSTVTRGQCVTFLWRAMGCPEPTTTKNPFVDVKTSDYYYKAVLWAVENNITVGVNATHFVPSQTCSTAHIITFLYRTLGVGSNGWYEEAGNWAQADHLLDDTGLTVSPKVDCPRAAVVTFLYRELA